MIGTAEVAQTGLRIVKMDCLERRLCGHCGKKIGGGEEKGARRGIVIAIVVTTSTSRGTYTVLVGVLLLRWPTFRPMMTFPDNYGGRLIALH